jgi:Protein of unknown function (DUF3592)
MASDQAPTTSGSSTSLFLVKVLMVLFIISAAFFVPVGWQAYRDYRVANVYLEGEAEIIEFIPINTGYDTRPGERINRSTRPSFVFRFVTKDAKTVTTRGYDAYGGREAPPSEWNTISPGDRVPCWYDPKDPDKAVLSRRFNPHYYWLLALPLCGVSFTGLLLRECFRRAVPPVLKGVGKGTRLAWRLPVIASQRGMTGCFGVGAVFLALLTAGFTLAALDYQVVSYRHRWLSQVLGFPFNGWYEVAFIAFLVFLLFLWAFLYNLRWVAVPEPVVEVGETTLAPGQSTEVYILQRGPCQFSSYLVSLVCEVNAAPGQAPEVKKTFLSEEAVAVQSRDEFDGKEWSTKVHIPSSAMSTCKSVPLSQSGSGSGSNLVRWYLRVERRVTSKNVLVSDFELIVQRDRA